MGGICWVIRIGGTSAGKWAITAAMASVPPVDAPMAINLVMSTLEQSTFELSGRETVAVA